MLSEGLKRRCVGPQCGAREGWEGRYNLSRCPFNFRKLATEALNGAGSRWSRETDGGRKVNRILTTDVRYRLSSPKSTPAFGTLPQACSSR